MTLRRLIYVPGVRAKPPPDVHRAVLRECLLVGLTQADPAVAAEFAASPDALELVPWGKLFYPTHRDIALDRVSIDALIRLGAAGPEQVPELSRWPYRLNYGMHLLGDRFPYLINAVAGPSTRFNIAQTERYFANRNGEAAAIRAQVAETLQKAWAEGASVLLMAHSLGSVIAYETLWELSRRPGGPGGTVDLFLTLGSPLGTRFIRRRLLGRELPSPDRYPEGIKEWRNLAALGGLTALGRRLADAFGEMQAAGRVEKISDRLDLINPFRADDGLNVHKCYGYFVNPVTGSAIARWWRGQSAA